MTYKLSSKQLIKIATKIQNLLTNENTILSTTLYENTLPN